MLIFAPTGQAHQRVLDRLAGHGVESDRISFVPHQSRRNYFLEYQGVDLCLDTLPYNGHTTSLDGLWMGVPMVTRHRPNRCRPGGIEHALQPEPDRTGRSDR